MSCSVFSPGIIPAQRDQDSVSTLFNLPDNVIHLYLLCNYICTTQHFKILTISMQLSRKCSFVQRLQSSQKFRKYYVYKTIGLEWFPFLPFKSFTAGLLSIVQTKETRNLSKAAAKALLHPLQLQLVVLPFLLHLLQLLHHLLLLFHGLLKLWSQQFRNVLRLLGLSSWDL